MIIDFPQIVQHTHTHGHTHGPTKDHGITITIVCRRGRVYSDIHLIQLNVDQVSACTAASRRRADTDTDKPRHEQIKHACKHCRRTQHRSFMYTFPHMVERGMFVCASCICVLCFVLPYCEFHYTFSSMNTVAVAHAAYACCTIEVVYYAKSSLLVHQSTTSETILQRNPPMKTPTHSHLFLVSLMLVEHLSLLP